MKLYQEESDEIDELKVCVWGAEIFTVLWIAYGVITHLLGVGCWNF